MLELELSLRTGDFHLEATLEARAGITVLYGPSGAGKTTVLDCIAGARRPDRGHVRLDGRPLFDSAQGIDVPAQQRHTPRIYQDGRLFPHQSVRQNLLYGATPQSRASLDEVTDILEIGELLERRTHELSGGQRQRVALGRALLAAPRALLLDEPLAALDRALRLRIAPYLRALQERFAIPLVYVTHAIEEALLLGDQVVLLDSGRVIDRGPADRVLAHAAGAPAPVISTGDSLLHVRVEAHHDDEGITECCLGDVRLRCERLPDAIGTELYLALSPRDVILASERPQGLSARNAVSARVARVEPAGTVSRVSMVIDGAPPHAPTLETTLTRAAMHELGVTEGGRVLALFKSSALRPIREAPPSS